MTIPDLAMPLARGARAAFAAAWITAAAPALVAQSRTPRLISTEELAQRLNAPEPPAIVDTRAQWTAYLQNHLLGARWLNMETLRATDGRLPFQLLPSEVYAVLFSRLGVRPDRPVVVYSAGDAQDVDATFVAWVLAGFGQREVMLLDGGYAKWELEGRPVTQGFAGPPASSARLFRGRRFAPLTITLEELRKRVGRPGLRLVDARAPEQFAGQAGAQPRRGRIPGAVNHPWKDDLETRDLVLVWKSPNDLRRAYVAQGITPDQQIVVYCNTGTEASHLFFALKYLLGYPDVRIYSGSWTEWSEREDLPIER